MQRFVLSLGFILKFWGKKYITVLEEKKRKKKEGICQCKPVGKILLKPSRCCFVTVCSVPMELESLKTLISGLHDLPASGSALILLGEICQALEKQHGLR